MRAWARSPASFVCGSCAAILPASSPVLRLFVPGLKHMKVRCPACADEAVPVDLPVAEKRPAVQLTAFDEDGIERPLPPAAKQPTSIRRQAERFDWKSLQAGGE